jgi:hypothetical protein
MGQGHYTMIALGTTNIPPRPDDISEDDWEGWRYSIDGMPERLRSQYEAKPYLAISIAISDGWLQEYWKVPIDLERSVFAFGDVYHQWNQPIGEALALWKEVQALVAAHGRDLPHPVLLLICDYD